MSPLTALAVVNNATNIALTLAASIIIARFPNRPACEAYWNRKRRTVTGFLFGADPCEARQNRVRGGARRLLQSTCRKRGAAESVDSAESGWT
jgi:hypothetical protein